MTTHPDLTAVAKALASPVRLQILQTLGVRGTCACGDVVEALGMAQSTVSQHLKVLREAGLIRGTADGTRSCYCLDTDALAAVSAQVGAFLDGLAPCECDDGCC